MVPSHSRETVTLLQLHDLLARHLYIDFFHLKADTLAALCNFDNILNITKGIDVMVAKPQSTQNMLNVHVSLN